MYHPLHGTYLKGEDNSHGYKLYVTLKNAVLWYIQTQFVLHWTVFTSPLQNPAA
jgi:hypothetical protein